MSLFRPRKTLHVHFPHFLLSAFAAWRVAVFVSKTYAFRLQDLCFSPARPMVLEPKSAFRRGQELWSWGLKAASGGGKSRGGQRPSLLPASTRINQNFSACVVDMKGNGGLYFPANFKSSYARNKVKGKMKKLPACPMIIVKGYEVE